MPLWPVAAASAALLLLAAKAHGRQVRVERERAGYDHVVFGGDNPPHVEALWARDRRRYWTFVPPAAVALAGAAWLARPGDWGLALVAALLWAPTMGFVFAGLRSLAEFGRVEPRKDEAWARRAQRGSAAWWAAVALAAAATVSLLALR